MLTSIGTGVLATATRASLSPAAKRVALGSLTHMADRQVLPFSTLREEDDQEKLEELEASTEATPNAFGGGYEWEDPFRLKTQLTEEEVRLLPRVAATRNEGLEVTSIVDICICFSSQ